MSFIYSQALVEAFSLASSSGTDALPPSSGSPTPRPCLWHDKTMEPSRLSRFGLTCKPLTDDHGTALLTWWLGASRARTSAWPGGGQALTDNAAECGTTWPASLAKYDPASHTLKTAQLSLLEDLTGCLVTLPPSGLMRNGECWELPMLEPRTGVTESGFLPEPEVWPTPTASDHSNRQPPANYHTAKSGLIKHIAPNGEKSAVRLSQMVNLRMWPTPVASAAKGSSAASLTRKDGQDRSKDRLDHAVMASDGGQLNPDWVEWLMGWPIGHSALKPLETGRFQEWQQQHSIY